MEEIKEELVVEETAELKAEEAPAQVEVASEPEPVVEEKPAKKALHQTSEVMYKRGDMGHNISKVQEALNSAGLYCVMDGTFDVTTEVAIRNFQGNNGLEINGKIDSITWKTLIK